jgi:hypothetical protein
MKKNNKSSKLSLRTQTVANLSNTDLERAAGGWTTIVIASVGCWTTIMSTTGQTSTAGGGGGGGGTTF